MEILTKDKHRIYFQVWENSTPENIVLLHGNLASSNWWIGCVEEFKKIYSQQSPKGSVIAIDWRGCGKSSAPEEGSAYNLDVLADDVIQVLETLKIQNAHIVGHSTGGMIAFKCLAKKPDHFLKAVFLDSVGLKGVNFGPEMIDAFKAMSIKKELTAQVIGSTIYGLNSEDKFFKTVIVDDAFTGVKQVGIKVLHALHNINLTPEALSIKNPCLVVHGEHDLLLPIDDSKHLAQNLKNAKFMTLAGQGHCPNYENPKKCTEVLNNFLFAPA